MNEPPNVVSWLLTLFGLVLSVLGTVIILRWPTYATPIVQDKNTKKWVRLFAWTSDGGDSIGRWELTIDTEWSVSAHSGFSAPNRGIRPNGSILLRSR